MSPQAHVMLIERLNTLEGDDQLEDVGYWAHALKVVFGLSPFPIIPAFMSPGNEGSLPPPPHHWFRINKLRSIAWNHCSVSQPTRLFL